MIKLLEDSSGYLYPGCANAAISDSVSRWLIEFSCSMLQ